MRAFERALAQLAFGLNVLLLFLLIFERFLEVPTLVQVIGRGHPLVLHLPIGLLFLLALLPLWRSEMAGPSATRLSSFVAHLLAATTALTALAGLLLAQEEGYASDVLQWHKWAGVGVSLLSYALLWVGRASGFRGSGYHAALYTTVLVLLAAGHWGGTLTHGERFLWEPLQPPRPPVTAQTPVFEAAIEPLIEGKCRSCHNPGKAKGELIMTSRQGLLEGGENGPIWIAGEPEASEILRRIHLPLEDEHHMPPEGKAQLTSMEVDRLRAWIAAGADFDQPIQAWMEQDSLRSLVESLLEADAEEAPAYPFEAASAGTIQQLNTPFRTVQPLALASPALEAEIFVRGAYQPEFLRELRAVREQLVRLDLTHLPIQDDDLAFLATFPQLEQLILNGTDITGATLGELAASPRLTSLSLANTQVDADALLQLQGAEALTEVYVWNTRIEPDRLPELREQLSGMTLHDGFRPDPGEMLQLPPPILANDRRVFPPDATVVLENKFPGAVIRYSTDGTEPDSAVGQAYERPIEVEGLLRLRAKTVRAGWLSSETVEWLLFAKGVQPDTAVFMAPPHPQYAGQGPATLFDGTTGEVVNHKSGKWIGQRGEPIDLCIDLGDTPPPVGRLLAHYMQKMGAYIMPPVRVELWAGDDPAQLQLIDHAQLATADAFQPNTTEVIDLGFPAVAHRYFRVVVFPLERLPDWHRGKGEPAWVFVDELFLYPSTQ